MISCPEWGYNPAGPVWPRRDTLRRRPHRWPHWEASGRGPLKPTLRNLNLELLRGPLDSALGVTISDSSVFDELGFFGTSAIVRSSSSQALASSV